MPESAPHRAFTTERGSFCLARCDCGWTGMARRARSQARTDAERHQAAAQSGPGTAPGRPVE
ncbi:hypothetical protein CG747_35675 [Streptomyces sp. CB02959]|uniref:hypothetical protein n=1 Tax=Streptomyces sp. CB02959 TaxID=2020330 RepID=UPI000C280B2E|nr:hypothetical protein [Streptomyces sp. CB02959]PJN36152.1 hypothetical protein CG747_35675 [Streptomyces sp. CB02959]